MGGRKWKRRVKRLGGRREKKRRRETERVEKKGRGEGGSMGREESGEHGLTCDEASGGGREAVELLVMFGSLVHRDDPRVRTPCRGEGG